MAEVYFEPQLLSRAMSREQWLIIWRKYRLLKAEVAHANFAKEQILRTKSDLPSHIRRDIIEELTYPPLIMGPGMGTGWRPA